MSVGTAEYHHAQAPRGYRLACAAVVALARCGTHCVALRVYIGMLFCEVAASRCANAPLGVAHRFAPSRVYKTHPMQSTFAGADAQPSALPGRVRALRAASWLSCGCCGTVALVRRFAQCFWSVACGQSYCVCPARPVASPLRGIGPALVCPSAPKGLPQSSVQLQRT